MGMYLPLNIDLYKYDFYETIIIDPLGVYYDL